VRIGTIPPACTDFWRTEDESAIHRTSSMTQGQARIVKFLQQWTSIFIPTRLTRKVYCDCMIDRLHFVSTPLKSTGFGRTNIA
jgi:hypothetical protein